MAERPLLSLASLPLLSPGILGAKRSASSQAIVEDMLLDNPLPHDMKIALLCAAFEDPSGKGAGIHTTGITLLGQGAELIDVEQTWALMAADPQQANVLRVTMRLGRGDEVPARAISEILQTMGPWGRAWQDLMVFASWIDGLYRSQLPYVAPCEDPRLDDWLAKLVAAGIHLPA